MECGYSNVFREISTLKVVLARWYLYAPVICHSWPRTSFNRPHTRYPHHQRPQVDHIRRLPSVLLPVPLLLRPTRLRDRRCPAAFSVDFQPRDAQDPSLAGACVVCWSLYASQHAPPLWDSWRWPWRSRSNHKFLVKYQYNHKMSIMPTPPYAFWHYFRYWYSKVSQLLHSKHIMALKLVCLLPEYLLSMMILEIMNNNLDLTIGVAIKIV